MAGDGYFQYTGLYGKYPAWLKKLDVQFYSSHCEIPGPDGPVRVEVGEWASQDEEGNVLVGLKKQDEGKSENRV